MDWEPTVDRALTTNIKGTSHADENLYEEPIIGRASAAKNAGSTEPLDNRTTINRDTITSEAIDKGTAIN